MSRLGKFLWILGAALLTLLLLSGCSLLFRDAAGREEWYIKLNIGNPSAVKAISVGEYDVTEVYIELYAPEEDQPFYTATWYAQDGSMSYLIPVSKQGQYRIEVTHVGDDNGEPVEAKETASFNIAAMVITVINVTPGAVGVIEVEPGEIVPEEPIDLTGYWVWYYTPVVGGDEFGPILLYIHQTENFELYANLGMSGFISGSTVTLFMPDYGVKMVGTVSGDEIAGEITMGSTEPGSFRMHAPTESIPPFGHLELQGNVGGIPISPLTTDFGLGNGPSEEWNGSPTTHFEARYFNHELEVVVWMSVSGAVPEIGELDPPVTYNVPDVWFGLRWLDNGQGIDDYNIEVDSGSMTITRFDASGVAGTFNIFDTLGNPDTLSGSFDLSWWEEWSPEG